MCRKGIFIYVKIYGKLFGDTYFASIISDPGIPNILCLDHRERTHTYRGKSLPYSLIIFSVSLLLKERTGETTDLLLQCFPSYTIYGSETFVKTQLGTCCGGESPNSWTNSRKKILRVSLLAIHCQFSTALALRFLFLQTHETS
jgi:hypothetical protein